MAGAARPDHYATLGIPRDATPGQVKKAYKDAAKRCHPDTGGDDEAFKRLGEAYRVLSDPKSRKAYDAESGRAARGTGTGHGRKPAPSGAGTGSRRDSSDWPSWAWAPSGGFGDLDDDVMDGFFGSRRHGEREGTLDVAITFAQSMSGADASIGDGTCIKCYGTGIEVGPPKSVSAGSPGGRICPACDGSGYVTGGKQSARVRIPAGAYDGLVLDFPREGGSLRVRVTVQGNGDWARDGSDAHGPLPLTPAEAAVGSKVGVSVPGAGTVRVAVPPGTQHGKRLRLAGQGAPGLKGRPSGDLILTVRLEVPDASGNETWAREYLEASLTEPKPRR